MPKDKNQKDRSQKERNQKDRNQKDRSQKERNQKGRNQKERNQKDRIQNNRNRKDIKFKDPKEYRDIPWEERPGGNIFARILKSLMRTIKYALDPEYRYTVKLMDQYAVKAAFQHDTDKSKEKSVDIKQSQDKQKTVEKEIEPKKKAHEDREKDVIKENDVNKENDLSNETPKNPMEIFKEENAQGFDVVVNDVSVNISLDMVLEYFEENKVAFDDPQKYVKAANEFVNKEKDYVYAHELFIKKYGERYSLSEGKGYIGCDVKKIEEYLAENNIRPTALEEYEAYADKYVYKCMEECEIRIGDNENKKIVSFEVEEKEIRSEENEELDAYEYEDFGL